MTEKRVPHQQNLGIACPHCEGPTRTRSSRAVTPLYRQLLRACLDVECGFTFGVEVAITHGISPSARPNPAVELRMAPPRKRAANDNLAGSEVPAAANDDCAVTEATG